MKVIKRDGRKVEYDSDKIVIAISKANKEVGGKDKISRADIEFIIKYIENLEKTPIFFTAYSLFLLPCIFSSQVL